MRVSVPSLPSIASRGEIREGMTGLRPDLHEQMLADLLEQAPARRLFAWVDNGLTPHDKIMRSLELLATKCCRASRTHLRSRLTSIP